MSDGSKDDKGKLNDYDIQNIEYIEGKPVLVIKSGEWLERYMEVLFKLSDFKTKRNKKIDMSSGKHQDVTHEIDVWVRSDDFKEPILIECKDVNKFDKNYVDAFLGKLSDIEHKAGVMVTSNLDKATLAKYKNYCQRKAITFFDGNEIDEFIYDLEKKETIPKRKQFIYDKLGIELEGEPKKKPTNWIKILSIGLMVLGVISFLGSVYFGLLLIIIGLVLFYWKGR